MKKVTSSPPVHAHADQRQRIRPQELQTRTLPTALHLIGRLALEAPQLRDIQCRVLRDDQLIGTHVDAAQRSRRLFEIVQPVIRFGEHDLGVGVAGPQGDGPFQPTPGVLEAVGQQRDPTQLENGRIVVGGVSGDAGILLASLGKLPDLEEPIGGLDCRWLLDRGLSQARARRDHHQKCEADAGRSHCSDIRAGDGAMGEADHLSAAAKRAVAISLLRRPTKSINLSLRARPLLFARLLLFA